MSLATCIIADDMTGAGDAGIQYQKAGHTVYLSLNSENPEIPDDADVVVINSNSRFLSPAEAYSKVYHSVSKCWSAGITRFYKKIDSTMRGNVKEEVDAILDVAGLKAAVISPAAPKNNRTVKNGNCYVGDQMIHLNEAGMDTLNPVFSSYIPDHFSLKNAKETAVLGVEDLHVKKSELLSRIRKLVDCDIRYIVCDAETPEDLEAIAGIQELEDILLVGSSGLAELLSMKEGDVPSPRLLESINPENIIIINGSRMEISSKQSERLLCERSVYSLSLMKDKFLTDPAAELARVESVVKSKNRNSAILLNISGTDSLNIQDLKEVRKQAEAVSFFVGSVVKSLLKLKDTRAFIIIGGETSAKIMDSLEIEGVEYMGEVLPGIPFGQLHGRLSESKLYFISKSGGFGEPETLIKLFDFFTSQKIEGAVVHE